MELNSDIFDDVRSAGKKLLLVTKYYDALDTQYLLAEAEQHYPDVLLGLGENRVESLEKKELSPSKTHFIGNIQSRKIPKILEYCHTIHSLDSLKHSEKINSYQIPIEAYIQIRLDENKQ